MGRLMLAKRPPLSLSQVQIFGGVYWLSSLIRGSFRSAGLAGRLQVVAEAGLHNRTNRKDYEAPPLRAGDHSIHSRTTALKAIGSSAGAMCPALGRNRSSAFGIASAIASS